MVPFGEIMAVADKEVVGDRDLPILSITMHEGLVDQRERFGKRIAGSDISKYRVAKRGQLVMGFPIDEGVLDFQTRYDLAAVSPAYSIWELTGDVEVDLGYFAKVLRSPWARAIYASKVRGTAKRRRSIPKAEFKQLEFPLPPLPEQKRIAAILDAADALRTKRRKSLELLDELVQSVFLDMFGDPVTNPKGWEAVAFGEATESRLGKMLDKSKESGDAQYPYLGNANVQWGRFDLAALKTMDFSSDDRVEFALRPGDLLVCEGGEVGRSAIWQEADADIYFQKAIHRVRVDADVLTPEYLYYYMRNMAARGGFARLTSSSTIAHLTGVKLRRLPLPLPPLELQTDFADVLSAAKVQRRNLEEHLTELDALFASLQSRAFRGEL